MRRSSFKRLFRAFAGWSIRIGSDPARVPPRTIVLFPFQQATLCCGLAGILTIRGPEADGFPSLLEGLRRGLETMGKTRLDAFIARTTPISFYLEGLEDMAQNIQRLKEAASCREILNQPEGRQSLQEILDGLQALFTMEEKAFDQNAAAFATAEAEVINSRLTLTKDILWELERDILENSGRMAALAGSPPSSAWHPAAFNHYYACNFILNALDRLEVRGRDSAGVQVAYTLPDQAVLAEIYAALKGKGLYDEFLKRTRPGDLQNGSIACPAGNDLLEASAVPPLTFSFCYKTFSVIGELGKNVAALRGDIARDAILYEFASRTSLFDTAIAHTRWASVGSITEENCHPLNNFSPGTPAHRKTYPRYGTGRWSIFAVLNGDIDNYHTLREGLETARQNLVDPTVTTDTKMIPLAVEAHLKRGCDLTEAFRLAVKTFEGSHAIALTSDVEPGRVFLALRGSGQAIYVGVAPDAYVFSSELYGLIERTPLFLKMDGEKPSDPDDPASNGQVFVLDQRHRGVEGIRAFFYDGTPVALAASHLQRAEITTRDIDRRHYPHFFLKEISESPRSVRKTLQGKYRSTEEGRVVFNFGDEILPAAIRAALQGGRIRRVAVIGHGTAAVAGAAVADGWRRYLQGTGLAIEAQIASEMSGFALRDDLRDTLIIPITQSGTTTDTNRAVAMARERGAWVIAIVNRRQSDITAKAHGVFYTSDGRDIEMSVASTKAFYSQIIAGCLLGLGLAQLLGSLTDEDIASELRALEGGPAAMERVLGRREAIRKDVARLTRGKQHWAVVGSGPNKAAADEIRIKLSELCYKTLSTDVIENKKHIDLSAEPLIIACAAGSPETVTGDIVKDVAIFKAHKAGVVVFADEGETRFDGIADAVVPIPRSPQPLPVILNTVAGHLWGYYAALTIDEDARLLREFRSRLNACLVEGGRKGVSFYERIAERRFRRMVAEFSATLNEGRQTGAFSVMSGNTLSDLVLLLKYAVGKIPLEDYWEDFKDGDFSPLERLDICLGHAIDELSRPVDAIRHQAKTVTVGTSRKEERPAGLLFDLLAERSFSPRQLTSRNILTLSRIQPAVSAVTGHTLYAITGLDMDGNPMEGATIAIVHRGGISLSMPSRSEHPTPLMGTKRTLASMGHVYVGKGKLDGAPLVIIPILGEGQKVSHLLLVHVRFDEGLSVREKIHVLGYKFNDIRNLVNEYNLPWEDAYIEPLGVSYLFSEPVEVIATRIKADMAPLEAGAGSRPTGPAGIANDLYNPDQTRRREK